MIDEKKLIEELQALATSREIIEYTSAYDTVQDCIGIVEKQPKTDWIPCEERLPENNTNIIACFSCGTVTELRHIRNGFFQGIYEYDTKVIIAWQPLPQPYKKEGVE